MNEFLVENISRFVILAILLAPAALILKRIRWANKAKQLSFALVAVLLVAPVLMPAGTISAIPVPNIYFFIVAAYSDGVLATARWYLTIWSFTLPSFVITFSVAWLLSRAIFSRTRNPNE